MLLKGIIHPMKERKKKQRRERNRKREMESQKGSEGVRQEDRDTESIFFCEMQNNKRKKVRK